MKTYKNSNDSMRVGAEKRNGKFIIIIEKQKKILVATKGSRKPHIEVDYTHFEKTFDEPEQANAYFKGILKNNPTLKEI